MNTLYLRIYTTVVAVLLAFALVAALVLRHMAENERVRIEAVVAQRVAVWSSLIENNLPSADADEEEQRQALLEWSRRLRVPLALENLVGQRVATSPGFARREAQAGGMPERSVRVRMVDGRTLWLMPPTRRLGPGGRRTLGNPWDDGGLPRLPGQAEGDGPADWWGARGAEDRRRLGLPAGPRLRMPGPAATVVDDGTGRDGPPPPEDLIGTPAWFPSWLRPWGQGGLVVVLGVLFLAVAAGSYPVVRRLTRRLEALKQGVETFGSGRLEHRVPVNGSDEVAAVARSFNLAAQRIEDLVRSNRSLLANASHELRSPLARLKMALAMLDGADDARRNALKAEIEHDIRELDALVEEVLLASRLDASSQHELVREPVPLLGVLAEEAARVEVEAEGDDLVVQGDDRLLRRAVRNLLENARRHGGGEVQAALSREGAFAVVRVCDRGPGVPESERERIFEPFYRLAGHGEQAGGVGLGLALVRQIAERHGGRVHCEPREGGGSCFVLAVQAG
jgi:signal transduction histidine kinase